MWVVVVCVASNTTPPLPQLSCALFPLGRISGANSRQPVISYSSTPRCAPVQSASAGSGGGEGNSEWQSGLGV